MTARTENVCVDSRFSKLFGLVQAVHAPPSMLHWKVAPGVSLVKLKETTGPRLDEPFAGPPVIVTFGGGRIVQL
jgi:hypothetical protein